MANSTCGIIGTMIANTSRNLCPWMILLSRSISRYRPLFQPSWISIKTFLVSDSKKFKMLLHGIQVWWYRSPWFRTLPKETCLTCEDVQAFSVWEKDAKDASGFVGYCYLDLFPRGIHIFLILIWLRTESSYVEAKYSHAAVWPLLAGYDLPNNRRHYPLAAMVANLAKPTPDKPALMRHDDVVTFFHEMGHVFHGLLSKTKYSRFHGTK